MTFLGFSPLLPPAFVVLILSMLVLFATLRLTRLVTTDSLGDWWIRKPLGRWAANHERMTRAAREHTIITMLTEHPDMTDEARRYLEDLAEELDTEDWVSWQGRLISGLYCPYCVGFWIGAAMVILTVVLMPLATLGTLWLVALSILSLSYVVGHLSAQLD